MLKETRLRSVIKTVSWRTIATLTTAFLVFIFTKRFSIALAIGSIEIVVKITLYFFHERLWNRLSFGRREAEPFVIWFSGLPFSGKTTIGDKLFEKLKKMGVKVERIDGEQVRHLFPEEGFTREARSRHVKRIGHLASILEKNGICVIASFISPYTEDRDFVRKICKNFIEVYTKASLDTCMKRDYKGLYQSALKGDILNFTGVSDVYEEPKKPELIIDTQDKTINEATEDALSFVEKKFLKAH